MFDVEITAKELREELKASLNKWRKENPAPCLEIEPEPELPEPAIIRVDKALLIVEVEYGDKALLHIVEGNATRKVELSFNQVGKLIELLVEIRKPMKAHKNWKTFYEEDLNRHEYEQAAWQRQLMAFKESVKRRLGLLQDENTN